MKSDTITEILSLYKKYGWQLDRVLLTDKLRRELGTSAAAIFDDHEIATAPVDAAWFTRDSGKSRVAWELRHLSENPFALFESFEKSADEGEISEIKSEMETRLANLIAKRNN